MKKFNYFKLAILIAFTSIVSLAFITIDDDDDFELIKNLEIYHTIMKELRLNYVDEIKTSELISFSIKEMLLQLDRFTIYYPENVVEDYTFMNKGEFGGIGLTVNEIKDKFIITDILLNKPASEAGLKIGDEILKIDNVVLNGKSIDDISTLLKGETGSTVKIQISNSENVKSEYTISRVAIESKNVTFYTTLEDNIGYIKLENFLPNAGAEVQNAFEELQKENKLNGLILDLRANPGGLLIEAVNIVNIFVEKDVEIVQMRGKSIQSNNIFNTTNNPVDTEIPLIVLVNGHSASASEIVSGALQDLDRAVVIGQRSYGKGLVQITKDLIYNTKLKITTAKYYIPSGRCIQAHPSVTRDITMKIKNVPDSVLIAFKTKGGRTVYDGAGIYPDIYIPELDEIEYIDSLSTNFMFFQFANKYHQKNSVIPSAKDFKIDENIYSEFCEFVKSNYSYISSANKKILELLENEEISKNQVLKTKTLELNAEIEKLQNEYLIEYKSEIELMLGYEIIKQYYYKEGNIEYDLYKSNEIKKSKEIFSNLELYNTIFKP